MISLVTVLFLTVTFFPPQSPTFTKVWPYLKWSLLLSLAVALRFSYPNLIPHNWWFNTGRWIGKSWEWLKGKYRSLIPLVKTALSSSWKWFWITLVAVVISIILGVVSFFVLKQPTQGAMGPMYATTVILTGLAFLLTIAVACVIGAIRHFSAMPRPGAARQQAPGASAGTPTPTTTPAKKWRWLIGIPVILTVIAVLWWQFGDKLKGISTPWVVGTLAGLTLFGIVVWLLKGKPWREFLEALNIKETLISAGLALGFAWMMMLAIGLGLGTSPWQFITGNYFLCFWVVIPLLGIGISQTHGKFKKFLIGMGVCYAIGLVGLAALKDGSKVLLAEHAKIPMLQRQWEVFIHQTTRNDLPVNDRMFGYRTTVFEWSDTNVVFRATYVLETSGMPAVFTFVGSKAADGTFRGVWAQPDMGREGDWQLVKKNELLFAGSMTSKQRGIPIPLQLKEILGRGVLP